MPHYLHVHSLQVKAAEKAAINVHTKLNLQAAPIRQYLVSCRTCLSVQPAHSLLCQH